uniref:Uncharacterized protein n=1 Tax=Globodera rostochiensis TaxID=31243 RepID=A0A914HJQ1_GLORO
MLGNCGQRQRQRRRRTGAVTTANAASAEQSSQRAQDCCCSFNSVAAGAAAVGHGTDCRRWLRGKSSSNSSSALQLGNYCRSRPPIGRPRRHDDQRAAFDLVRLEQQLALAVRAHHLPADSRQSLKDEPNPNRHRVTEEDDDGTADAVEEQPPVDGCRQQCDEQLRMGLDMVKAHSAFGSIGVPSVLDVLDLQLFCRVDTDHDTCLLGLKFV